MEEEMSLLIQYSQLVKNKIVYLVSHFAFIYTSVSL